YSLWLWLLVVSGAAADDYKEEMTRIRTFLDADRSYCKTQCTENGIAVLETTDFYENPWLADRLWTLTDGAKPKLKTVSGLCFVDSEGNQSPLCGDHPESVAVSAIINNRNARILPANAGFDFMVNAKDLYETHHRFEDVLAGLVRMIS